MLVDITTKIEGKGDCLYCVLFVHNDDPEDSYNKFWKAQNSEDLYEQIKKDRCPEEDPEQLEEFDEAWDNTIKFEEIGKEMPDFGLVK